MSEEEKPIVPAGADLTPNAGGTRDYRANPEDFLKMLEHMNVSSAPPTTEKRRTIQDIKHDPTSNAPDVDAMKEILLRVHDSSSYAVEKASTDNETRLDVKKAILHEDYQNKEWKVRVNSGAGRDVYDVTNLNAHKSTFEGIYLREAADKLCKLLERGEPLNSPVISKVLYYDEMYKKHFTDAMHIKRSYKSAVNSKNKSKAHILESKFDSSKEKALKMKSQIKKIL